MRTHAAQLRALDAELERMHGLSFSDYDVLATLASASERRLRMAELAGEVLLTRSGLTRLVDGLQRSGLVERVRCPEDGRGLHAQLTDAGLARAREASRTLDDSRRRAGGGD